MSKKKKIRVLLSVWCVSMCILTGLAVFMVCKIKAVRNQGIQGGTPNITATPKLTGKPMLTVTSTPQLQPVVFSAERSQMAGTPQEEHGETDAVRYGMRYPQFDLETLDVTLRQRAEELLEETLSDLESEKSEPDKPVLLVDYDSYRKEQLVSVRYVITLQDSAQEQTPDIVREVYDSYNLTNGTKLTGETMFRKSLFAVLRDRILWELREAGEEEARIELAQEAVTADAETFASFLLSEEGITFFAGENREYRVMLSYEQVNSYLKVSLQGVVRDEKLRELDPNQPMLALTFDDGPHGTNTEYIVDLLKKYNARATFFMLGNRVEKFPDVVKYVYESGNQIASHTYSHQDLANISETEFWKEIRKANEAVYAITGESPIYLRPPYGSRNEFVLENAPMVLVCWNVDSEDWKSRNKDKVVEQVMKDVGDGKIVLLHDIHDSTAEAVELLLPKLIDAGYQLVTLEELFYYKGVEVKTGTVYHSSYN